MFRPLRLIGRNAPKNVLFNSCRTKIMIPESFLDKAERMKLWNRENKLMFGSILETQKAKEKRISHKEKRKRSTKSALMKEAIESNVNAKNTLKFDTQKMQNTIDKKYIITDQKYTVPENKPNQYVTGISSKYNGSNLGRKQVMLSTQQVGIPSIIVRNLSLFPMLRNHKAVADPPEDVREDKIVRVNTVNSEYNKFPVVTKILDQTMSEESRANLAKWKAEKIAELGEEGFERYHKGVLQSGTRFHSLLSDHLLSSPNFSVDQSTERIWASVSHVLKDIQSPKAVESHVVHPVLKYRGVIDCIAVYQDKPTLIEWKKSDKPKTTLSSTYDNPIQLAAYFGAISHDPVYKALNVRDALLVIAYPDGSPADVFRMGTEDMRRHWAEWLTRLEKYWTAVDPKPKDVQPKTEA